MKNEKFSVTYPLFKTGIISSESFFKSGEISNDGKIEFIFLYSLVILMKLKRMTPLLYSYLEAEYFKDLVFFCKSNKLFFDNDKRIISFINLRLNILDRLLENYYSKPNAKENDFSASSIASAHIKYILFKKPFAVEPKMEDFYMIEYNNNYQISQIVEFIDSAFNICLESLTLNIPFTGNEFSEENNNCLLYAYRNVLFDFLNSNGVIKPSNNIDYNLVKKYYEFICLVLACAILKYKYRKLLPNVIDRDNLITKSLIVNSISYFFRPFITTEKIQMKGMLQNYKYTKDENIDSEDNAFILGLVLSLQAYDNGINNYCDKGTNIFSVDTYSSPLRFISEIFLVEIKEFESKILINLDYDKLSIDINNQYTVKELFKLIDILVGNKSTNIPSIRYMI